MKLFLTVIFLNLTLNAAVFEAKPVADLFSLIQKQKFKHVETGMSFGFVSIQSCLYVSSEMILLRNYCFPKKNYPAKGFTVLSEKFGVINFYQEQFDSVLKRDIEITAFDSLLKDYLQGPFDKINLSDLNNVLEKIYESFGPACWSTNFTYSEGEPQATCHGVGPGDVLHFEAWAAETQSVVLSLSEWKKAIELLEEKSTPSTE